MGDKTDLEKLNEGIDGFNNNQLNMIRVLQAEIGKDIADYRTEVSIDTNKVRHEIDATRSALLEKSSQIENKLIDKIAQSESRMTDKLHHMLLAEVGLIIAVLGFLFFK